MRQNCPRGLWHSCCGGAEIPAGQTPRGVLNKRTGFIGQVHRATEAIWRYTPRGGLTLMYSLAPAARLRKRFRFYEDAQRVVRTRFSPLWRRSFARAPARRARRRGGGGWLHRNSFGG